jgi:CBS-domain-containing membrane protein
MWENDCGAIPIITNGRKVVGMLTDRDICMAGAYARVQSLAHFVEEAMTRKVYAADADEDIDQALHTMREHKVHRLPVLNRAGDLEGIVSMNDIVLHAKPTKGKKPPNRLRGRRKDLPGDLRASGADGQSGGTLAARC